ncbi:MAG: hypothetical protein JW818_15475 [Pirellulales bacterium]|nr:hypothetical protein [Pirellulales bacterium]
MNTNDLPTTPADTSKDPASRRPWWRLHLLTWVVLAVVTVALVLIMVPADRMFNGDHGHGWPWVFLRHTDFEAWFIRITQQPVSEPEPWLPEYWTNAPWAYARNWGLTGDAPVFSPLQLVGDVLIAVLILAVAGAAFECWRRRRRRIWQFSIREMLLLTLVIALVLGWWKHNDLRLRRELALAERLGVSRKNGSLWTKYIGPEWLGLLVGTRHLQAFRSVSEATIGQNILDKQHTREALDELEDTWPYLNCIAIKSDGQIDSQLGPLNRLQNLNVMYIECDHITEVGMRQISRNRRLRTLELKCRALPVQGLAFLTGLPSLEVIVLECPNLRGADLAPLANLSSLEDLWIISPLEDRDIAHLHGLTQLKLLDLCGVRTTLEATMQLEEALPECEVEVTFEVEWE